MTALAWRLFRSQALWGAGALVVVGIVLLATGPHLASVYDAGVSACRAAGEIGPACNNPVLETYTFLQVGLTAIVLVGPALVGVFWGAPLFAREFETGTFRLAWTQSVTRGRWLAVKLAVGGAASFVAGAALSLMVTWWFAPLDSLNQNRFSPAVFQVHGVVPGGYALFAFALGATTGVLFRRVLPAMATTLVAFVVVREVTTFDVRPYLLPPEHLSAPLSPSTFGISVTPSGASAVANGPDLPNAWVFSASIVDKAGHSPSSAVLKQMCSGLPGVSGPIASAHSFGLAGGKAAAAAPGAVQTAMADCITNLSRYYHAVATYQPADRFWSVQVLETALFVVLSLLLAGLSAWWVTHRLT